MYLKASRTQTYPSALWMQVLPPKAVWSSDILEGLASFCGARAHAARAVCCPASQSLAKKVLRLFGPGLAVALSQFRERQPPSPTTHRFSLNCSSSGLPTLFAETFALAFRTLEGDSCSKHCFVWDWRQGTTRFIPFGPPSRKDGKFIMLKKGPLQPNEIAANEVQSPEERRAMRRFDMRLPASVKLADSDGPALLTQTENVSARGVFFYLNQPLPLGTVFEVTLTLPPHVTLTDSVQIRFNARVVRVEPSRPSSLVGVGALIEEHEFLGSGGGIFSGLGQDLSKTG